MTLPTPVGWTGALLQYTHNQELQFCPAQEPDRNQASQPTPSRSPTSPGFTDYWFNARLSRVHIVALRAATLVLVLGEGNDGVDASNATYSKSALPQAWLSDSRSPLFRHLDGANYLFADGHVKWFKPGQAQHYGGRSHPFAP